MTWYANLSLFPLLQVVPRLPAHLWSLAAQPFFFGRHCVTVLANPATSCLYVQHLVSPSRISARRQLRSLYLPPYLDFSLRILLFATTGSLRAKLFIASRRFSCWCWINSSIFLRTPPLARGVQSARSSLKTSDRWTQLLPSQVPRSLGQPAHHSWLDKTHRAWAFRSLPRC